MQKYHDEPKQYKGYLKSALTTLFPQLEIQELLGTGGMGAVYKARQPGLDRVVALKVLPPEIGGDPVFTQRFAREAQALARLNHPHIVAVYEYGQAGDTSFIVMEFVDGTSLRQTLETGALEPEHALVLVPQICDALQYAHDEGVVHRDIKPENILLDRKGRPKIADFGLSKLRHDDGHTEASLTGTHQVRAPSDTWRPSRWRAPATSTTVLTSIHWGWSSTRC